LGHRLDGEVARQRHRSGEVIDAPLTPREALDPQHAARAQPPVALQGRRDPRDIFAGVLA